MKKLILISALALTMLTTGCATRTQTALLAGGTGVVIGSMLAQPRPIYVSPPTTRVIQQEQVVIINEQCSRYYSQGEQEACARGARQRYYEEQRRKENEAFRQGLGR